MLNKKLSEDSKSVIIKLVKGLVQTLMFVLVFLISIGSK